ncbi:hypothetical protein Ancab_011436 [Ancistrocladus abbreviatus]
MIKPWWIWAHWISPLSYAQNAVTVNEFTATRWQKVGVLILREVKLSIEKHLGVQVYLISMGDVPSSLGNHTIGYNILTTRHYPTHDYWYWLGVGVLFLYALLFNNIVTVALAYLKPLKKAKAIVPSDNSKDNDNGGKSSLSQSDSSPYQYTACLVSSTVNEPLLSQ